jgi:hypothetical protein
MGYYVLKMLISHGNIATPVADRRTPCCPESVERA